jgi:TonB family protein
MTIPDTPLLLASLVLCASGSSAQKADTGRVFTEGEADITPILLREPRPLYPDSLRRAGIGGTVTVQAIIDTTGRPESTSIRVMKTPDRALIAPARAVVLGSRFNPARAWGRHVRYLLELSLELDPHDTSPPPPLVYTQDSVDQVAKFLRWHWTHWRPVSAFDSVQLSHTVRDRVVFLMIVDSLGHPDTTSIQIVEPRNPLLLLTIRPYVAQMLFSPARRQGHPVPVLMSAVLPVR